MLNSNPMKPLFLLTLIVLGFAAYAGNRPLTPAAGPVANAGPDQTIYLTQTSSVTLDGSASTGILISGPKFLLIIKVVLQLLILVLLLPV